MSREEQMAEAVLGRDAEVFCKSELGQFMLAQAKEEKIAAMEKLAKLSPFRILAAFELRNEIWRAESFDKWLAELIVNGRNAERSMEYGTDSEV